MEPETFDVAPHIGLLKGIAIAAVMLAFFAMIGACLLLSSAG